MSSRRELVEALARWGHGSEVVRAAWLGGSDANGRADALSDIDILVLCAEGAVEACIASLRGCLAALHPVAIDLRLPMPTWHGFDQGFIQLGGLPESLMVDWLVIEVGRPHPWFEVERHGTPVVLVDRDGLVRPGAADRAALLAAAERRLHEACTKFALFRHLPGKFARRGLPVDAAHFHHALVVRTLVDVLRSVHCPDRFDFGPRYLADDLPAGVYARLMPLLYPAGPDAIEGLVAEASAMLDEAVAEWQARCADATDRRGHAAPTTASGPAH